MATTLYTEAIAEAKQLTEMAEQRAKNKIIDAVTPRIRQLIEKQLLGEQDSEDADLASMLPDDDMSMPDSDDIDLSDDAPSLDDTADAIDLESMAPEIPDIAPSAPAETSSGPSIKIPAGTEVEVEIGSDGSVALDTGTVDLHVGGDDHTGQDDELLLNKESIKAITDLILGKNDNRVNESHDSVIALRKKIRRFDTILGTIEGTKLTSPQRESVRNHYTNLLREAISLRDGAILNEGESDNRLMDQLKKMIKEMKQMSKRRSSTLFDKLFEAEEKSEMAKTELDELDATMVLAPEDEEEQDELETLLGDLDIELEVEPAEEGGEDEGEDEADEEEGEDEDEEGGLELGEMEELAKDEMDELDETYEIDEAMLRRELRKMRQLREETSGVEEPSVTADAFGGGDVEDEAFVDVDEETLLNALADELGAVDAPSAPGAAAAAPDAMGEAFRRKLQRRIAARNRGSKSTTNESRRNRALNRQLAEYKKAVSALRQQLTEMNLFNAKLLYANKIMQNRNVTPKQQRSVVEALDSATTLREAKLLYKSLTSSLNKSSGGALTESSTRRTVGSSSRPARSATPAKNGAGVDRWAVLAGINNKK